MLVGLADDDTDDSSDDSSDDDSEDSKPVVVSSPRSTLTFDPLTIIAAAVKKPTTATIAPRPPTAAGSSFLDKVLPRKTGADGQVRIWGLPPAVAYVIALILVGGGGYLAVKQFGGGRRVATNPRRRRRGARRARRSKR